MFLYPLAVIGVGSRMQKYWMVIKPVTDEGEKEEEPNVATIVREPESFLYVHIHSRELNG